MRLLNYFFSNVYVSSLLGVGTIVLILKQLQFVFGNAPPLLLFLVVIAFAAWFGGLRVGLFTTIASSAASMYFLIEPYNSIHIAHPRELLRILFLITIGAISSLMIVCLYKKEKQALQTIMEREKQLKQEIERRVRTSEEWNLYATLVHGCTEFIGMCDTQGMPFLINAAGLQLVGLDSLEQGLKTPVREFFFPEDQAFIVDEFFSEVVEKGRSEIEIRFRHFKTAEALWMIYNVFALRDLNGNLIGWGTVSVNISLRKQAEEALRQSEYRLRRFYDSGLLGVIYWNIYGLIVDANDKFLEMVGYDREDLKAGRIDWQRMTPPEYRHLDERGLQDLLNTGLNAAPFEKEYICKDGTHLPVIIAGAMLDEERINGVAFVLDITARKQMEEELLRLNAELEQRVQERTAELQRNKEQLITSLHEKEVLLKEIHHRVKNNLQIIASLLKMQADSQTDHGVRELFRESQSRIRSMALLHEHLYKTQDLKTIDFANYVAQLINHIHRSFARTVSRVTVRLEIPSFLLDIDHALPLGLIINELVSNSFKYAFANLAVSERREIWITMAQDASDGLILEVGDSGCGLPDEVGLEQSPSLGLQLVQSLVLQLNGRLTVQCRPGAVFHLLIPWERILPG